MLTDAEREIKCDNKAATTLATGEGSWKTKSAANKVYFLREQVEFGFARVEHVSTNLQAADSLTKFLTGGTSQKNARELLGMQEIRAPQPGRRSVDSGVLNRIQVCRICVPGLRENANFLSSAAISALQAPEPHLDPREDQRQPSSKIMVRFVRPTAQNVNELGEEQWSFTNWQQITERFEDQKNNMPKLDGVDILSIAARTDPIPVKDVDPHAVKNTGYYMIHAQK